MQLLPGDEWIDLFQRCTGEAFHLEVRDAYAVPAESEHFRRFLDGEPDDYVTFQQPWLTLMRDVIAKGVAVRRVRVVSVPHSDYHRWVLVATAPSVEAGEDIRYVRGTWRAKCRPTTGGCSTTSCSPSTWSTRMASQPGWPSPPIRSSSATAAA